MDKPERSKYVVFYPDHDGKLLIQENVGINELTTIYLGVKSLNREDEVLVFNMSGISEVNDIKNHPENTYYLITISNEQPRIYENVGPEIDNLLQGVEKYYIVDDIYFVTKLALNELITSKNIYK